MYIKLGMIANKCFCHMHKSFSKCWELPSLICNLINYNANQLYNTR